MGMYKLKGCAEDLEWGTGTTVQYRNGHELILNKIDTSYLVTSTGTPLDVILGDYLGHSTNYGNPHRVDKLQLGLDRVDNTNDLEKPVSNLTQDELNLKLDKDGTAADSLLLNGQTPTEQPLSTPSKTYIDQQDALSFVKTDHVVTSVGASDAGKPLVLDSSGRIDPTIAGSGLVFQGMFTPTAGDEYPPTDGNTLPGYYWGVIGVDDTAGYTFVGGDLIGQTIYNNDAIVWGRVAWGIFHVDIAPEDYYRLDGSYALESDFQAGGFKLINLSDGTDPQDAATLSQITNFSNSFLALDGTSIMSGSMDMGTNQINNLMDGSIASDAMTVGQGVLNSGGTMTGGLTLYSLTDAPILSLDSGDGYAYKFESMATGRFSFTSTDNGNSVLSIFDVRETGHMEIAQSPIDPSDAVPLGYLSSNYFPIIGGNLSGNLTVDSDSITVNAPTSSTPYLVLKSNTDEFDEAILKADTSGFSMECGVNLFNISPDLNDVTINGNSMAYHEAESAELPYGLKVEENINIYASPDLDGEHYKAQIMVSGTGFPKDVSQSFLCSSGGTYSYYVSVSESGGPEMELVMSDGTDYTQAILRIGGSPIAKTVVGEIKLFSGNMTKLDSGWHICDGSKGTPNMSGDFKTYGAQTVVYIQYIGE